MCTQRPSGAWCWGHNEHPTRTPELDGVVGVSTWLLFELYLQQSGKLRFATKPLLAEDGEITPPGDALLVGLPLAAQLTDHLAPATVRGRDGSVYRVIDNLVQESEDDPVVHVRRVERVPLPSPAVRLERQQIAVLANGTAVSISLASHSPPSTSPLAGSPPPNIVAVGSSDEYRCVLTRAGAIWCEGRNTKGQLGIGTTDAVSGYRQSSLPPACALQLNGDRAFAVLRDGSVWSWGSNLAPASAVPAPVSGLAGVVAFDYPYALSNDGSVRVLATGRDRVEQLRFNEPPATR